MCMYVTVSICIYIYIYICIYIYILYVGMKALVLGTFEVQVEPGRPAASSWRGPPRASSGEGAQGAGSLGTHRYMDAWIYTAIYNIYLYIYIYRYVDI